MPRPPAFRLDPATVGDLRRRLGRAAADTRQAVVERLDGAATAAVSAARGRFGAGGGPGVVTGRLRRSVSARRYGTIVVLASRAPHAHLLEFGTARAPAYPFLYPAADQVGRPLLGDLRRLITRTAERTWERG